MFLFVFLNKKGMTVVELTVALAILVLVSGIASIALIRVYSTNKYVVEQGLNNSNLQVAVSSFTKNIREARQSDAGDYLILSGDDFNLKFFSDINNDGTVEKIHYFLEDNYFKLGISEPSGFPPQYPINNQDVRIIGSNILNNSDEPIFYYYNGENLSDLENNPLETPIIPNNVSLIKLHLIANVNSEENSHDMNLETLVRPRNIEY
jgi:prepilin-type N-terminal cleavage/methylation domain-containing protein